MTFKVDVVAAGFFAEVPSLSADGIMSFRLGPGSFGIAHVWVVLEVQPC